jgi:glycosyltransferase involved in cell wall biosynthesis
MDYNLSEKNILQIIGNFGPGTDIIGGSGIIMRSIALESKKNGANVKVAVDGYSPAAPSKIQSWNRDGLEVIKFPLLRSMPKSVKCMGKTQRRYLYTNLKFSKLANLTRPDIVHFHIHPNGLLRLGLEFKKKTKAKIIVTTHGLDSRFHDCGNYKKVAFSPQWTESVEAVDIWVPCSPVDHKGLLEWGIPDDKIYPIYNGVEVPESLPALKNGGTEDKEFRITYVGRMIERKGILDLADSMVEVVKQERDRSFVLTMLGGYKPEILKSLKKCLEPVNGKLKSKFQGELSNNEVKDILYSSDIFCYPTKSPREGLPLSILEAGAYGCPMVLSDHYAHLSIYKPEVHANFFKMSNKEDLAQKLLDLIRSKEKRNEIRKNTYKLVKEKFNIKEMLNKYMLLYSKLLQSN